MPNHFTQLMILIVVCSLGCSTTKTEKRAAHCDACWAEAQLERIPEEVELENPYGMELPVRPAQYQDQIDHNRDEDGLQTIYVQDMPPKVDDLPSSQLELPVVNSETKALHGIEQPETSIPDSASPQIIGTRLPEPGITATEHALRLLRENQELKAAGQALKAENERLKMRLKNASELLARVTNAVSTAQDELNIANSQRQLLISRISELEADQKRQNLSKDRLLQSIKDELDDVLMREINSSQQ